MKDEPLLQSIGEFRGDYPDIQLEETVLTRIKETDSTPHFFTLPLGKVGAFSRNMGRNITRRDIELIVAEVNNKKPEGRIAKGHLPPEKRAGALQDAQWLAAIIDGDTAWGKFYVFPRAKDEYQVLSVQAAARAKAGTSVYGEATRGVDNGWEGLNLSAIDISTYPQAVSQLDNMAVPLMTSELHDPSRGDGNDNDHNENEDTSMDKELVQELTASRDGFRDDAKDAKDKVAELTVSVNELTQERDQLQETLTSLKLGDKPAEAVAELRTSAELAQAISKAIAENAAAFEGMKTDKPAEFITELATALADASVKALDGEISELIAEMVKAEPVRPYVQERIDLLRDGGKVTSKATAEAEIKAYMETDTYKKLAQSLVSEVFGGNTIVTGRGMARDAYEQAGGISMEETVRQLGLGGGQ